MSYIELFWKTGLSLRSLNHLNDSIPLILNLRPMLKHLLGEYFASSQICCKLLLKPSIYQQSGGTSTRGYINMFTNSEQLNRKITFNFVENHPKLPNTINLDVPLYRGYNVPIIHIILLKSKNLKCLITEFL